MNKRRIVMLVSFQLPEGATFDQAVAYTAQAVASWSGSLQPPGMDMGDGTFADGDPMFNLDAESVRVERKRWN